MLKALLPTSWHYPLSQLKRKLFGYKKYSQFGEDAVLLELFKDKKEGVYIDVGAHHPYRYSNTYLLYRKGWRGINIDPNEKTIALFNKARLGDSNVWCGVGKPGLLTYYRFSDPAVNTFVAAEAKKWMHKSFLTFEGTTVVPVRPLSELITGPIDLLCIDAEGMDLEVVESYDWRFYPRVVVIEGAQSQTLLVQHGYTLHKTCGPSHIYVQASGAE